LLPEVGSHEFREPLGEASLALPGLGCLTVDNSVGLCEGLGETPGGLVDVVCPSSLHQFLTFRENAYLALVVKVQQERGQSVVSTGPYRYVRHPMYASMFLFFPASALLLGSWWGLLLCAVLLGLLVWRIPLEERMLENGLDGYDEYERDVRYRLIPRVW
jgi:protein-S-isoprenylcysteine O-methyltransferase Ste14